MAPALAALLPTTAGMAWLLSASVKAALLLAASWLGAALLRRGTAAARHQVWTLGVAGALLLPLLSAVLPALPLSLAAPTSDAGRSLLVTAVFLTGGAPRGAEPAWPLLLALLWIAGTLFVSLRFLRGHLAAHRLWRTAEPANVEAWSSARREAAASLGIAGDVDLGRSEAVGSPMTLGVLRPRVLLPAEADGWSPSRLRAVLLHELGHVRRHDTLIQLGAQLMCTLYWWNPLAWLAAARLRIEREHACDDLVLGAGVRPSSYAADLLAVARRISSTSDAGAVCMADPSGTEARLRRILDAAAPRRPLGAPFRFVSRGATLAFAVTLACTSAPPASATPSVASRGTVAPPVAPRATVALGTPSPETGWRDGPSSPAVLAENATYDYLLSKALEREMAALQQCYERRLLVQPGLAGVVLMHWIIEPSGEVADQCITEDSVADAEVAACVNKLIADARFPVSSRGSINVELPFVFTGPP